MDTDKPPDFSAPVEQDALLKFLQATVATKKPKERNSEGYSLLALTIASGVLAYYGVIEPDQFVEIAKWVTVTYAAVRGGKKVAEALVNGKT